MNFLPFWMYTPPLTGATTRRPLRSNTGAFTPFSPRTTVLTPVAVPLKFKAIAAAESALALRYALFAGMLVTEALGA